MATLPKDTVGPLAYGDSWESANPVGSLGSMIPIPPLNFTGGAAAPSQAFGGAIKTNVFSQSGGGGALWYSIAAIILGVVWMRTHKK